MVRFHLFHTGELRISRSKVPPHHFECTMAQRFLLNMLIITIFLKLSTYSIIIQYLQKNIPRLSTKYDAIYFQIIFLY